MRKLRMSKVMKVRRQQMEKLDPLVQRIAVEANLDTEYIEMLNYIEADVYYEEIDSNSELKALKEDLQHMSIITLDSGNRLIVKNETEILIPKSQRSHMMNILHVSRSWSSDVYPMPWEDLLADHEIISKEEI